MKKIKYYQRELGGLEWDVDKDYGNEYVNVHIRINAWGYQYPDFNFKPEERKQFYTEVREALEPLGWKKVMAKYAVSEEWECNCISNGKQELYLHPQDFSGYVLKNNIKVIVAALQGYSDFEVICVDLYETVYDIPDDEYEEYLNSKDNEIKKMLFTDFTTSRSYKFYSLINVCASICNKVKLPRIDKGDDMNYPEGQTMQYIKDMALKMAAEGLVVIPDEDNKYIRSLNKTEQKKLKIKIV